MIENDCGCIPIVESMEKMRPLGTITDRDIVVRAVGAGLNPLDLTVSDVMSSDVVTIKADATVDECCDAMESRQIRRVLVVDSEGFCCGIVAQADVARNARSNQTAEVVQEISGADLSTSGKVGKSYSDGKLLLNGESILSFIAGIGSGAAAMYFLDPDRGRRRRALIEDKVLHLKNEAGKTLGKKQRHLHNRAKGVWAETKKAVSETANSSD